MMSSSDNIVRINVIVFSQKICLFLKQNILFYVFRTDLTEFLEYTRFTPPNGQMCRRPCRPLFPGFGVGYGV
jgi:hypothetical protein